VKGHVVLFILAIVASTGCAARDYYGMLNVQQEMNCEQRPGADRDECSRQSGMSYDEYQRLLKERQQDK
jgi:hypothetical protein